MVGYHIRDGNYGELKLDGLDFIYMASWTRAIHEGNGVGGVYITDRASSDQRAALVEIAYGRARLGTIPHFCYNFSPSPGALLYTD